MPRVTGVDYISEDAIDFKDFDTIKDLFEDFRVHNWNDGIDLRGWFKKPEEVTEGFKQFTTSWGPQNEGQAHAAARGRGALSNIIKGDGS